MFPTDSLEVILDWLKGGAYPGLKELLTAQIAIEQWAVGQLPDGPTAKHSLYSHPLLDTAALTQRLESLQTMHATPGVATLPSWLIPTLLQVLQLILTNIGTSPS